jgi:hypothetical protein
MFEFFRFELRYWLKSTMLYIFIAVMALLFGLAVASDDIQIGGTLGNTFRNAPYVIQQFYAVAGTLSALMITTFFDSAASRDFSAKFSDILFSKPIRKYQYLLGRFLAATFVGTLPLLGISIGIIVGGWTPGRDPDRWCPIHWQAHWMSIITFAIPNTILIGAIVFAIASWTRSTLYSFLGVLGLLVGYSVALSVGSEMSNEKFAMLADPLGISPFSVSTKYWTTDQRNNWVVPLTGWLLANRVIWLSVSALIFGFAAWRFRFETPSKKTASVKAEDASRLAEILKRWDNGWPRIKPSPSWIAQFISSVRMESTQVLKSPAFIVIISFGLINAIFAIIFSATEGYGLNSFPVTYKMVDLVRGSLLVFMIAILTYFAGVLVWKDRDNRIHEIVGATPVANSALVLSHVVSLMAILMTVLGSMIVLGCVVQFCLSYTRYQLPVYMTELIGIEGIRFGFLVTLALLAHTMAPNKYLGYFLFVVLLIMNAFLWQWLRIETLLVRFGRFPSYIYSDMFGFAPYAKGMVAFFGYWLVGAAIVLWVCSVAAHRGIAKSFRERLANGIAMASTQSRLGLALMILAMLSIGGWLYYNTQVLNTILGSTELEKRLADYEKTYATEADIAQPRITDVRYEIDIFPSERNMNMKGNQTIENKSESDIELLYINLSPQYDTQVSIPGAELIKDDDRLGIQQYRLATAMQPGDKLEMTFSLKSKNRGIENQVSNASLVQNGTFFNNQITPSFGYNPNKRLLNPDLRKKYDLPPADTVPELTRECGELCNRHYIGNDADWVNVETVISTSADQIAVAPGTLTKSWQENNRNYYHYKLDHPSLNFYSFISAEYEVDRSKFNDIDIEVYYHKEHAWNVPRMARGIKDALTYCSTHFGEYRHRQARIIEFPRVATFAQAFPGTMPYSESIGFIANLTKPDDIDMVYYVVAHEMAHQWWAHQVIGARMQGATLLSETMAQYTALMIMKKEYGPDMMHKFLRYEMDLYLRARGTERMKERPLISVNPDQGYIHYRKGSVALYYLSEMIGEQRINAALKEIIELYAYQGPPYPNSYALVDRLKKQTPPELQYLIKDLFEEITLFENRTLEATVKKLDTGKFLVSLEVECSKWKADEKGAETEVEMDDWLEVGAFAKPEGKNRYGRLLHNERIQLKGGKRTVSFELEESPYEAGVDPRNFLIDRIPDDNMKRVETVSS